MYISRLNEFLIICIMKYLRIIGLIHNTNNTNNISIKNNVIYVIIYDKIIKTLWQLTIYYICLTNYSFMFAIII